MPRAIANGTPDNLTSGYIHGKPDPLLVALTIDKRPSATVFGLLLMNSFDNLQQ